MLVDHTSLSRFEESRSNLSIEGKAHQHQLAQEAAC
jgi:hypothetical protein